MAVDGDSPQPLLQSQSQSQSPPDIEQGSNNKHQPPPPQQPRSKPSPPPAGATYVVLFPKDAIIRQPPPHRQIPKHHSRRRNCCRCCFCWLLALIILLSILLGVSYLVYRPKSPNYSVQKISIQGFNLSSSSSLNPLSPKMNVTIRTHNPNSKIGIYYNTGSSIAVYAESASDVQLCTGVWPNFYHGTKNVTIFQTRLKGSGLMLAAEDYASLKEQQKKKAIPLKLNLKVPIKIKAGIIKSWTITVKVRCSVTVDGLTNNASIVSNKCSVNVKPWE